MVFNITWSVLQHRKMSLWSFGGRISSRLRFLRQLSRQAGTWQHVTASNPPSERAAPAVIDAQQRNLDFRWLPGCRHLWRSRPQGQSKSFEFDVWEEERDSRSSPLWFLGCDLQDTETYSWMIWMSSTCGTKNRSENHHHLQESIKGPSSMICTTLTPRFGSSCCRGWCFSMHVTDISCYCFILFTWCVLRLHPF